MALWLLFVGLAYGVIAAVPAHGQRKKRDLQVGEIALHDLILA